MTPQVMDEACVQCGEVITNPICIDCLELEMKHWLMDKPGLRPMIKATTTSFKSYKHNVTFCIICGNNMRISARIAIQKR